jgi:enoyl-CoA hydratase/carnithine racemase
MPRESENMAAVQLQHKRTLIDYKKEGGVGIAEFNHPPANTYTYEFMQDLDSIIEEVRFDEEIGVCILTNKAGTKMFSAGAHIPMLQKADPKWKAMFCLNAQETLDKMARTPKVFISAIRGHCVGGGLEIALATDLRFMARGAGKIGLPEVTLGVLPGTGGTQRLARLIGASKALDLMITGRLLEADEAEKYGILNYVWDQNQFWDQTWAYAQKIAKGPRRATGFIKRAVVEGVEQSLNNGLALERELQNQLFAMEDAKEGFTAYVEKRQPVWKNR